MKALHHYTLNTADDRISPRSEVGDAVLPLLRPLLEPGHHELARFGPRFSGWSLRVDQSAHGWIGALYEGSKTILVLAIAGDAADEVAVWPELERLYLAVTELPGIRSADFAAPKKPELPWCAVAVFYPPKDRGSASWIADLERCLAWAWLERPPKTP